MHDRANFVLNVFKSVWFTAVVFFLLFLLFGCDIPLQIPDNTGGNGGTEQGGNTGVGDNTITNTTDKNKPKQDVTTENPDTTTQPEEITPKPDFRPCVLVEETVFNKQTDTATWKPSYYYTPRENLPMAFTDDGVTFCRGTGCRAGITLTLGDRDVSGCPSMAFRVQGTIFYQSLGGAGWDNREAPIAVMIQYTDANGVKHSSLNAFNEGEPDDRLTTRMFWWGFGYLEPTKSFYNNFTPNITAVEQSVQFDKTINFFEKLDPKPKLIHTITIEGSGWGLDSVVKQFSMKPLEAFADPEAPYREGPPPPPYQHP